MKITILKITNYEQNTSEMEYDEPHIGKNQVMRNFKEEVERKVENNEWEGLPFTCEADDIDEALDLYNNQFCKSEYLYATEAEYEEEDDVEKISL